MGQLWVGAGLEEGAQAPALPSRAPAGMVRTWGLWRDWILKLEGVLGCLTGSCVTWVRHFTFLSHFPQLDSLKGSNRADISGDYG